MLPNLFVQTDSNTTSFAVIRYRCKLSYFNALLTGAPRFFQELLNKADPVTDTVTSVIPSFTNN